MFSNARRVAPFILAVLVVAHGAEAALTVEIQYEATPLGGTRWQYTYDVINVSANPAVSEFTIWFDRDTQRNLALATANPVAGLWNELAVQPDLFIPADGYYDALTTMGGISAGNHVSGFAVAFDWLGAGVPGAQRFDVVDPVNFTIRESGWTVPEPGTALLMSVMLLVPGRRFRRAITGRQLD